jgi:hypothetical protein
MRKQFSRRMRVGKHTLRVVRDVNNRARRVRRVGAVEASVVGLLLLLILLLLVLLIRLLILLVRVILVLSRPAGALRPNMTARNWRVSYEAEDVARRSSPRSSSFRRAKDADTLSPRASAGAMGTRASRSPSVGRRSAMVVVKWLVVGKSSGKL